MKPRDLIRLALTPSNLMDRLELERVRKQPRYTEGTTRLFGNPLKYIDSSSYYFLHEEIFQKEVYRFSTKRANPRIIDGGANIGLSVIYFKKNFPNSRITAFEADPKIALVCKENLISHGIQDVEVHSKALWSHEDELSFEREGADGGKLRRSVEKSIKVPAVPLAAYLNEPVDFLKLDVEGAEWEILNSCSEELKSVDKLFVEYHSSANQPQILPELLELLRSTGFRIFITSPSIFSPRPFLEIRSYGGFDMVLNIYCTRA
jgi:FkbM family methyltransferase